MKKIKKIFALTVASFMLVGCNNDNSSSETNSSETDFSSESSVEETSSESSSSWEKELQELMIQYCGEVLPYPEGLLNGKISYGIAKGKNGEDILQICDESDSFTLTNYYQTLNTKNWYAINGYNGKPERSSNSQPFYELTKDGKNNNGFDLSYTFRNAQEATSETSAIHSGNVIMCYNNLTTNLSEDTKWEESNVELMKSAITVELPFFKMGTNYGMYHTSEDVLLISDSSTNDLRENALITLEDDGYVIEAALSKTYNMHILRKVLADGSFISVALSFTNGNFFQFGYSANPQKTTDWPSAILSNIEEKSGISIPAFYAKDIKNYYSYDKNGKVYVYAETQTNIEFDTDYYTRLENVGLHGDGWGGFATWEETVSLNASILYNYEYDGRAVQYAFCILVQATTPTSSFASSWPSEVISSFLKEKNINATCPLPTSIPSSKELKYKTEKDENNHDVLKVQIFDTDLSSYNYLSSYFENEAYFKGKNADNETFFENANGSLRLTFRRENGVTQILIGKGEGNQHSPVFYFEEEELSIGKGDSRQLHINKSMLPYKVTYSSSNPESVTVDENGLVNVTNAATVGEKVTITATLKSPDEEKERIATCEITIASRTPYTAKTAMDKLVSNLNDYLKLTGTSDALYTCYNGESDYYYVLHNFVGSTWNLANVQQIVSDNLLLEEYTLKSDWTKSTSSHGNPMYTLEYSGDGLTIQYSITINGTIILLEMRAFVETK